MCRLTAIISAGGPVAVADIVTRPKLSIIYQSFNCHERAPRDKPRWAYEKSTLNGDGFGVGWYTRLEDRTFVDIPEQPCVFTSLKPAWSDRNLTSIAEKTLSPLILAHIRAAGPGSGVPTELNCHPFRFGRFLFAHNGLIGDWSNLRRDFLGALKTQAAFDFALTNGPIDSVLLFALFIDRLTRGEYSNYSANELRMNMEYVLEVSCQILDRNRVESVTYLNMVVTDGKQIVAVRFALGPYSKRHGGSFAKEDVPTFSHKSENSLTVFSNPEAEHRPKLKVEMDNTQSLSLYFATGTRWKRMADGEYTMVHTDKRNEVCIITSEPLTESPDEWVPVPHNHLVIVTPRIDVLLQPLRRIVYSQSVRSFANVTVHTPLDWTACLNTSPRRSSVGSPVRREEVEATMTRVQVCQPTNTSGGEVCVSYEISTSGQNGSELISSQLTESVMTSPSDVKPSDSTLKRRHPSILQSLETLEFTSATDNKTVDQLPISERQLSTPHPNARRRPSRRLSQTLRRNDDSVSMKSTTVNYINTRQIWTNSEEPILCVTRLTIPDVDTTGHSEDGSGLELLFTGGQNGSIKIWNLRNNSCCGILRMHRGGVLTLATYEELVGVSRLGGVCDVSPGTTAPTGGRVPKAYWLFSGSSDTTVCIWNVSAICEDIEYRLKHVSNDRSREELGSYALSKKCLALQLRFEPRQGDVLSLTVLRERSLQKRKLMMGVDEPSMRVGRRESESKQRSSDFLFIGFQSTLIGFIRLVNLFDKLRHCKHFTDVTSDQPCACHNQWQRCPFSKHLTRDKNLNTPILVLNPEPLPPQESLISDEEYQSMASTVPYGETTPETFIPGLPAKFVKIETPTHTTTDSCQITPLVSPEFTYDEQFIPRSNPLVSLQDIRSPACSEICDCSIQWFILNQKYVYHHHCGFVECLISTECALYSGGGDGLVMAWKSLSHVSTMQGHKGGVLCLAADEESETLYSGSRDKTVRVWSTVSYRSKHPPLQLDSEVLSLGICHDFLFTGCANGMIVCWSRSTHERVSVLVDMNRMPSKKPETTDFHHAPASSPRSYCVTDLSVSPGSSKSPRLIVASCGDGFVRVWEYSDILLGDAQHPKDGIESSLILLPEDKADSLEQSGQKPPAVCSSLTSSLLLFSNTPEVMILDLLTTLTAMKSISGDHRFMKHCWNAAKYIASCLERLGGVARLFQPADNAAPIVVARIGYDPRKPTVILYSHYDVVPSGLGNDKGSHFGTCRSVSLGSESTSSSAETIGAMMSGTREVMASGTWKRDPWTLQGVDGYVYGRGVSDNKGPLVIQFIALLQLLNGSYNRNEYLKAFDTACDTEAVEQEDSSGGLSGNREIPNIVFVCEGDEESGSRGFSDFITSNSDLLEGAQYAVFTNSYWMDDETPCLVYGMRGVVDIQVEIRGCRDSVGLHSGIHGGALVEPLQDLVGIVSVLTDPRGYIQIPGFYDSVVPHDLSENGKDNSQQSGVDRGPPIRLSVMDVFDMDTYRKQIGYAGLIMGTPKEILQKRWMNPVLSVTEIWTSTQNSPQTVGANFRVLPSVATCNISLRIVPEQNPEDICKLVFDHLTYEFRKRRSPNKISFKVLQTHKWWQGDVSSPLFEAASTSIRSVWGKDALCIREGGTIPVISQLQDSLGVATIQIPIGQSSDNAHLPNERIRVTNLVNGVEVLKKTLWGLQHIRQRRTNW